MISLERSIDCASDICSMWNALGDTERLNRAIGNNPVSMQALDGPSSARFLASSRIGGFNVKYEERPYEWVYLDHFVIWRKMLSGPVQTLEAYYGFATLPSGATRVTLRIQLEPRYRWLALAVHVSANQVVARMQEEVKRIDTAIIAGSKAPVTAPTYKANEASLQRAIEQLDAGVDRTLVEKLVSLIRSGGDLEVARMRPFQLADEWKRDRREVLTACLLAVRAGLLDLRWDLICPSCRTVAESLPSLSQLAEHGRCQLCDIDFTLDLDEAVEATFQPSAPVRKVDDRKYCIGGPSATPHVFAQVIVPSHGQSALNAPEEEGRFRLFVRGGETAPVVLRPGAPKQRTATLGHTDPIEIAPAGRLTVVNQGSERHVKLERLDWFSQAASARQLSTLPAFRREFSAEVLRPGTSLKVARVTLLFTDLTDSTKLYANIGDAAAFRLVQDHFVALLPLIEKNGGALVKTIGDAIMAVFSDEDGAVKAGVDMLSAFAAFRRDAPNGKATDIKIGLFSGPCFAINANGVLDYFGQSVNVAARLQGQAKSGEVVMEAGAGEAAVARGLLGHARVVSAEEASLKGVEGVMRIVRIAMG